MAFINIEKAKDMVPRQIMWQILDKKIIPLKYVDVIESMYDKAITSVRTSEGM